MKKKTRNNLITFGLIGLVAIIGGYFLFQGVDNKEESSTVEEAKIEEQEEKAEDQTLDSTNSISNENIDFTVYYPDGYEITKNNLSNADNSQLILENKEKGTKATFYGNYFGHSEFFADHLYYMKKSDDGFSVSQKLEGFIPERDSEPEYSAIAIFGPVSGTSQVNETDMIVIWNADINENYVEDFESIINSLKEN